MSSVTVDGVSVTSVAATGGVYTFNNVIARHTVSVTFTAKTVTPPPVTGSCTATSGKCWYVDSSVASNGNGTSWASAWKAISNITGVGAGDVVYISGGPSGSTQTYSVSNWSPTSGTAANRITYKIGQDSAHNGTAIFNGSGANFVSFPSNIVISGDAGDGKMHFQTSNQGAIMVGDNSFSNLRLSYINFGNMSGSAAIYASTVNGFEFDHNYVYMNGANTDVILHVDQFNGNGYDQNWIHDNTLYSPTGDGYGADGLQMSGQGYSIYNNSIISYISSSWNKSEGQHPDGWQTSGGGYIKIYNNFVYGYQDIGLYGGCWGNAVSGGSHTFSNVQIYNNIVDGQSWQSVGSIEIEADNPTGSTFNNIGIYNNIVRVPAVMSGVQGWGIFVGSSNSGGTWTNISVANNLVIAPTSAQYMALYSTPAVNTNNVEVNDAGAAALLANLQNNSTASDYHYKSTATSLIGKGTNESSIFTMNKDGNLRPSTGAWNVGAY